MVSLLLKICYFIAFKQNPNSSIWLARSFMLCPIAIAPSSSCITCFFAWHALGGKSEFPFTRQEQFSLMLIPLPATSLSHHSLLDVLHHGHIKSPGYVPSWLLCSSYCNTSTILQPSVEWINAVSLLYMTWGLLPS